MADYDLRFKLRAKENGKVLPKSPKLYREIYHPEFFNNKIEKWKVNTETKILELLNKMIGRMIIL